MNSKINYYEILEINKQASLEEIKKSYKKLAIKHHPDKGGDPDYFNNISEAYQVLSDPDKRRIYDRGNIYDNLRGQNEFTSPIELFNFVFNSYNPPGINNPFSSRINTNPLFTNNFSKQTSVIISNGKKIEKTIEIKNGVKSQIITETDLITGNVSTKYLN